MPKGIMTDEKLEKISSIKYRLEKVEQLEKENLEKDRINAELQEEINELKAQLGK